jgi:hypothetical protein
MIIELIIIFGVGFVSGMYIATQIEERINKRIKPDKKCCKETYPEFRKKHYKK